MSRELSWSLVVATYARHEMLALCVRLAIHQSRPPDEVIIVDASPDWQNGRARIALELEQGGFRGKHIYDRAAKAALAAQRNQGIALASGDVLFLLDDDSLMYPDCAARALSVYEADPNGEVVGVGLVHVSEPPPMARPIVGGDPPVVGWRGRTNRWLTRMSWRGIGFFIPYDHDYPSVRVPAECASLGARPTRLLDGFRMTFRRSVCETLRFEELLRHSASYGEDHDFCYRASRVGAVVQLPDARLHHAVAPQGRASERTVITMLWCNRIALQACNGSYRARAVRRLVIALPLHFTILMLRDVVNGDLGLPRTRGLFVAIPQCLRLLFLSKDRVRQTYPSIQARLFGSKSQARS